MRCSSFEPLLDAYVDGELPPVARRRVALHLERCASCASLLQELRVIDALLLTPRELEPAPNFTFKLMAEIRSVPTPAARHTPALAVLGAYVVFGWLTIGAFLLFARSAAEAAFAALSRSAVHAGALCAALATAIGHLFGGQAFELTAAMGVVLAADVAVAAAVVVLYSALRARRAAALASTERC